MSTNPPTRQAVPTALTDEKEHRRQIAEKLNLVIKGKVNATLDVTLTANAGNTTVTDARIGYQSAIIPAMAMTGNASSSIVAGIYVDGIVTGSCNVHHHNVADPDQTIRFVILG